MQGKKDLYSVMKERKGMEEMRGDGKGWYTQIGREEILMKKGIIVSKDMYIYIIKKTLRRWRRKRKNINRLLLFFNSF